MTSQANERRIDRVLEPAYLAGLPTRPTDDLHQMRDECVEIETEISYVRRLAQARIDILEAEGDRRATGGSIGDLIAALPSILSDDGPRPAPHHGRLPQLLAPAPNIEWKRGLESLVGDATLATLPSLSDEDLADAVAHHKELEIDYSSLRRKLHVVIGALEDELAARLKADL